MHSTFSATRVLATALMYIALSCSEAFAGIHVDLTPSALQVAKGDFFDIRIEISQAADSFNAYTAVVQYDPTLVTYLNGSEGNYLPSQCLNTTFFTSELSDQVSVTHGMLCAGVLAPGPGQLFLLKFQALTIDALAEFSFASVGFSHAGTAIPIDVQSGTAIQIGTPTSAAVLPAPGKLGINAVPNPFNPSTTIIVFGSESPGLVSIVDVSGRILKRFFLQAPGPISFAWNGRDASGLPLPSGVYFVRAQNKTQSVSRRVILIK